MTRDGLSGSLSLAKDTHASRARSPAKLASRFISFSDPVRLGAILLSCGKQGLLEDAPGFRIILLSRLPRPRVAASNETQQPGHSRFHTRFENGRRKLGWISIAPQQLGLLVRNIVVASPQKIRAVTIAGPFLRKQSDIDFSNRRWHWLGQSFEG
jgi:hypothetical protein